ncbi:MAG: DUF2779 domain-containing protein [Gloeomargarita sp. SKYBB_i_bin120]|nr:DUF2779 domain-containing protein [Gloeomargarita sp. SKYB120]MDW8178071.1 DUF2779 domain-containing protein [Gloeomargarita sp. SKYBB_i_bin120]
MLTKSRYVKGLQCPKCLWLDAHAPEKASVSEAQKLQWQQGTDVGVLARDYFPGGVLVTGFGNHQCQQKTAQLLAQGATCLFEATFAWEGLVVKCDVLRQVAPDAWEMVEVKSTTRVKPEHLEDLAIQWYVVAKNGIALHRAVMMHLNPHCCYPDLSNLFAQVDVTAEVQKIVQQIPERLAQFNAILSQTDEPDHPIGDHCDQPYTCTFKAYCWRDVPEVSIFQIARLDKQKKLELIRRGIFHIEHLPPELIPTLSERQQAFIRQYLSGKPLVDYDGIKELLNQLRYPLHFFDFEATNPAIPRYPGTRPYQRVPFQFSCHVLTADGTLTHYDYLHTDRDDPRPPLVQALVQAIGEEGSIIVYNQGYEKSVLQELAAMMPEFAPQLNSMVDRLWDQMVIFRDHYQHPDFLGSTSLKKVLPVLVPELSYQELAIQQGDMAKFRWEAAIFSDDLAFQTQTWQELRQYCHQDTLAMVALHRHLVGLVDSQ